MDAAALIGAGRTLAAELRPDAVTVTRGASPVVFDPITGTLTPGAGTVIYTGECRVRAPTIGERTVMFGELERTTTAAVITFPFDVPALAVGDQVTVTASDDPGLLVRRFRIVGVPSASYLLYRRVAAEAVE